MVVLCIWELVTLKFNLMPLPYFPGPDGVLRTLIDDWQKRRVRSAGACAVHGSVFDPADGGLHQRIGAGDYLRSVDRMVCAGAVLGNAVPEAGRADPRHGADSDGR